MEAIFVAWLVGISTQLYQVQLWSTLAYAIILLFSLLSLLGLGWSCHARQGLSDRLWMRWCRRIAVWALIACMAFAWAGCLATYKASQALLPELEQQNIEVTGSIDALPQLQSGRWRFEFKVDEATLAGEPVQFPPKAMLSWYFSASEPNSKPELRVGQRWSFQVRVKAPHGNLNPHAFDYELWLWEQGIAAVGYVRTAKDSPIPELLPVERAYTSMEQWRETTRIRIMQTVDDPRQAGLIAALTLGDQRAIDRDDWDTFRMTGIAHLVSISGLHITMMAWLVYGLVNFLWRRSTRLMLRIPAHMVALLIGLGCACLYAWFAGWGVPAQRTVLMLATVVALRFIGLRWPWYVVWLFVGCVVLTIDPWAMLQAGFWLSFIAVGVLFAQSATGVTAPNQQEQKTEIEQIQQLLPPQPWWQRALLGLWTEVRQLLIIQARISIALAPLTLLLFQQVSVVGLLANLFAIPWVTFVMVPLVMLGIIFPPLWHIAAWAGGVLMNVLEWFASWPLSVLNGAVPPFIMALLAVAGAVVLVLPLFKWRYRFLGALAVLPIFLWQPGHPKAGEFEALFLDVGQGSAVLVRTANHALIYDVGPRYSSDSDAGAVLVVPTLRAMGVKLDRIVISHIDNDHAGGLDSVRQTHPQADVLLSAPASHPLWREPQVHACVAGAKWQWDGVDFEVLHPFKEDAKTFNSQTSSNAQSCVLRITSQVNEGQKNRAMLLTGDIEELQEQALINQAQTLDLSADVLLMPHHGSKTSSSPAFLAQVSPTWAVAQAGYLNRYGHPAQEVVDRYAAQQTQVINTPSCGAALWRSDQPDVMRCEREQRARYWHHQSMSPMRLSSRTQNKDV